MKNNSKLMWVLTTCLSVLVLSGCNGNRNIKQEDYSNLTPEQISDKERKVATTSAQKAEYNDDIELWSVYGSAYTGSYLAVYQKVEQTGELDALSTVNVSSSGQYADYANIALVLSGSNYAMAPLWVSLLDFSGAGARRTFNKAFLARDYNRLYQPGLILVSYHSGSKTEVGSASLDRDILSVMDSKSDFLDSSLSESCAPAFRKRNTLLTGRNMASEVEGSHPVGYYYQHYFNCNEVSSDVSVDVVPIHKDSVYRHIDKHASISARLRIEPKTDLEFAKIHDAHKDFAPKMYEQIKHQIPDDWYALFNGYDENGKWRVYVARKGKVIAFDMPKNKP